jgi:hypothetical protein
MMTKTYISLLLFILVASISLLLFSWSRKNVPNSQDNPECSGKCEQKKPQNEFILWESLSRNLFSFNR